jgi:hypothetical protein
MRDNGLANVKHLDELPPPGHVKVDNVLAIARFARLEVHLGGRFSGLCVWVCLGLGMVQRGE